MENIITETKLEQTWPNICQAKYLYSDAAAVPDLLLKKKKKKVVSEYQEAVLSFL